MKLKKLTACLLAGLMFLGKPMLIPANQKMVVVAANSSSSTSAPSASISDYYDNQGSYYGYYKYISGYYSTGYHFMGLYKKDSASDTGYAELSETELENITSYAILSRIGGKPVIGIGDSAFAGCSNLTTITIPESVTEIGRAAFFPVHP